MVARVRRISLLVAVALAAGTGTASAATSRITALEPKGTQPLSGGYEREFGIAHGVVSGDERVRGLPAAGLGYAVEYELIRPTSGPKPRMLLVEAENRGSPLLLDALAEL